MPTQLNLKGLSPTLLFHIKIIVMEIKNNTNKMEMVL